MTRARAALLFAILVGLAPRSAAALFPPRYVACQSESELRTIQQRKQPTSQWLPLPKKRVAPLRVAPMEIDDVAQAETMPSRRVTPHARSRRLASCWCRAAMTTAASGSREAHQGSCG